MIKVLFSDMDYTLLRPTGNSKERIITKEDAEAIKEMQREGFHFVVTTGRFSPSVFTDLKKAEIDCDVISSGGSAIYIHGELNSFYPIDLKLCESVFDDVVAMNRCTYFRFADEVHKEMIRFMNLDSSKTEEDVRAYREHFKNFSITPNKISISFNTDEEMNEIKLKLIEKYGNDFFIEQSMPTNLDLTAQGINKGSAIQQMLKVYGLNKQESSGIGDSYNDFAIFEEVELKFSVENGVNELKEAADVVVSDIAEAYEIIKKRNGEKL